MIHTRNKAWCSILPTGGNINYAMVCDTHLLYMGNNIFGLLIPKPAPTPIVSNAPPASESASQPLVTLPTLGVHTMAFNAATQPPSTLAFNPASSSISCASPKAPPPAKPGTSNFAAGNLGNETITAGQYEGPYKDDDSVSTVSTLILHEQLSSVTKVKDADVLNKECIVSLTKMSTTDLNKYLKPDKYPSSSDMFDSSDDVPLSQLVSKATCNSDASVYLGDQGRPRRRRKRVKYEESSLDSISDSDSDYKSRPSKAPKITPGSGPSKDRLHAHMFMKSKGKVVKPKTTLLSIVSNRNVAHTVNLSGMGKNTKSGNTIATSRVINKSSMKKVTSVDHEVSKPKGCLSVSHHGLKKF